jgi:hypothetical protein
MFAEGELMTCLICGQRERAHSQTAWRAITVGDERVYYVCPLELPETSSGPDDYAIAYQILMLAIVIIRDGHLLAASCLGPWVAARRSGKVARYSYEAFLEFLPNLIGSSLN